jgi:hypothetical protein
VRELWASISLWKLDPVLNYESDPPPVAGNREAA